MSQLLFERLITAAEQRGAVIHHTGSARYVKRLNEDDADLMAKAHISTQTLSKSQKLVRILWNDCTYFVAFGFNEPDEPPPGIDTTPLTPGIFVSSVIEAGVMPSTATSGAQIKDAIELDHSGVPDYSGHELDAIRPLFPRCATFQKSSNEKYLESDHRILGSIAARSYAGGPLNLEPDTLRKLANMFEAGSEFLPFPNLLQGLLSFSWQSLFLETYRCLEQLYAHPRVAALISDWPTGAPMQEIVKLLENHLSWRPKEDEALSRLIKSCTNDSIRGICIAFGAEYTDDKPDKTSESAANKIYKLRNNIVHYRPTHQTPAKPEAEWNQIIQAMLQAIEDIYSNIGIGFFTANPKKPV